LASTEPSVSLIYTAMSYTSSIFANVARHDSLNFWRDGMVDGRRVTEFLDITPQDLSRIAHVAKASVRYDDRMPPQVRDRLGLIANICNLVFEFFGDEAKTALWFKTANPMLGGVSPRDMIRFGRYNKLLRFVTEALEQGERRGQTSEQGGQANLSI
jgi:hypothetical protein